MRIIDTTDPEVRKRVEEEARFMIERQATVRQTALYFSRPKTAVHDNLRKKLPIINPDLYQEAVKVLELNKSERHIRGGERTKELWVEKNAEISTLDADAVIHIKTPTFKDEY